MNAVSYRAFVLRLWSREGEVRRASIEVVQSGQIAEVRGESARRLAIALEEALACVEGHAAGECGAKRNEPGRAPD